jgi:hypothetical protein
MSLSIRPRSQRRRRCGFEPLVAIGSSRCLRTGRRFLGCAGVPRSRRRKHRYVLCQLSYVRGPASTGGRIRTGDLILRREVALACAPAHHAQTNYGSTQLRGQTTFDHHAKSARESPRQDSNLRHRGSKPRALSTELRRGGICDTVGRSHVLCPNQGYSQLVQRPRAEGSCERKTRASDQCRSNAVVDRRIRENPSDE